MPSSKAFTLSLLLSVAAVAQSKGFYVSKTTLDSFIPGPIDDDGLQRYVFPEEWVCDDLIHTETVNEHSDVSGDKRGIRIKYSEPDESNWGAREPIEAEIHTSDYHVTWYKDRDNKLYDLGGTDKGSCKVDKSKEEECDVFAGTSEYSSVLRCEWKEEGKRGIETKWRA